MNKPTLPFRFLSNLVNAASSIGFLGNNFLIVDNSPFLETPYLCNENSIVELTEFCKKPQQRLICMIKEFHIEPTPETNEGSFYF